MCRKIPQLIFCLFLSGCGGSSSTSPSDEQSAAIVNVSPSGEVIISGALDIGGTLSLTHSLSDSNGLGALQYQWFRSKNDVSDVISNEILTDYVISQNDVGYSLLA